MNLGTHPARAIAAVGAVVAAGTTVVIALTVGTASADEPGHCTQNVNVREEPDATSRIVAMCEEGTAVMLGSERDHFVFLDKLHGWASKDYVKPDETAAGAHGSDAADSGSSDDAASGDRDAAHRADSADGDGADVDSADADRTDHGSAGHESADDRDAARGQSEGGDADSGDSGDAPPAAASAPRRAGGLAGLLR
jgi:hypothetical protein